MVRPNQTRQSSLTVFTSLTFLLSSATAYPQTWDDVGGGMNGKVRSLAVHDNELYAGGSFTAAGGVTAYRIAKWNGFQWAPVGSGWPLYGSTVRSLATFNGELYAGGSFTTAGAKNIAKWNGFQWSPVGSGTNGDVHCQVVYNGELYAGGKFTTAGGATANYVAKWDGSSWSPVASGMGGSVWLGVLTLVVYNGELYAGGDFTTAGGATANYVAKWDGSSWSPVGTGTDNLVVSLAVYNNELYVAGIFNRAGGIYAPKYAKWNGESWSPVGSRTDTLATASSMAVYNNELYAGGYDWYFDRWGGSWQITYVAKWNGSAWSSADFGWNIGSVYSLSVHNNQLYAGGYLDEPFVGTRGFVMKLSSQPTGGRLIVSGNVSLTDNPLSAVTLNLSGSRSATAQTNFTGGYSFSHLPEGNYTVTPTKGGFSFSPPNYSYSPLSTIQTGQNFVATDVARPSVTVLQPNGGENLGVGHKYAIRWQAIDNDDVKAISLLYSVDGGASFQTIATALTNSGSYEWVVSGPPTNTALVRVTAYDAAGLSSSDISNSTFRISENLPEPASNLTAAVISATQIILRWQDNSSNESGFGIERRKDSTGPWVLIRNVGANTSIFEDNSVSEGSTYYYRVYAFNSNGSSDYSNTASATATNSKPLAPSNLLAETLSPTEIMLTWKRNSENELGFRIERKVGASGSWLTLREPSAGSTTYTDMGLAGNTTYFYRVYAYNSAGNSAYSNEAFASTSASTFDSYVRVTRNGLPVADASVFVDRGQGFQEEPGRTGPDGGLLVRNLMVSSKYMLRAEKMIGSRPAVRGGHDLVDNRMYELWFDSDFMTPFGSDWQPITVLTQLSEYELKLVHPIFKYNAVVSIKRNQDQSYFDRLRICFVEASDYIYNVTDGQAALNKVAVYDNAVNWDFADIRIWPGSLESGAYNEDVDGILREECVLGITPICWPNRINIGETLFGILPDFQFMSGEYPYARTLIHEFGHYAFGFYDEYINGLGLGYNRATGTADWKTDRTKYPFNYGFMENQLTTTEASAASDYLKSYPLIVLPWEVTLHYFIRRLPCWEWLKKTWEEREAPILGIEGLNIVIPPFGWYPDGYRFKRLGSETKVGLTEFIPVDAPGGGSATLVALSGTGKRMISADVYGTNASGLVYLGKTASDGTISISDIDNLDTIFVSKILGGRLLTGAVGPEKREAVLRPMKRTMPSITQALTDSVPPGVVFEVKPTLMNGYLLFELSLISDEGVIGLPEVKYTQSGASTTIVMNPVAVQTHFQGNITVIPADLAGSESAFFQVTLMDSSGNPNSFVTQLALFPLADSLGRQVKFRGLEMYFQSNDLTTSQVGLVCHQQTLPHSMLGRGLLPASGMFSVRLTGDSLFLNGAGLNIRYTDADLGGLDESSLDIFHWHQNDRAWIPVQGSHVDSYKNLASALVHESGTYALFASSTANDFVAPAKVKDLTASSGSRDGELFLNFTSPGDDSTLGTAAYFVVKFATSEISEANWDSASVIAVSVQPKRAGEVDTLALTLPKPNQAYFFALKSVDESGNVSPISNGAFAVSAVSPDTPTSVSNQEEVIPEEFHLYQNYPNPFNPATMIEYELPFQSHVDLRVYNILGQEIKTLTRGIQSPGRVSVPWNGLDSSGNPVATGVYFYRVVATPSPGSSPFVKTNKMLLLR